MLNEQQKKIELIEQEEFVVIELIWSRSYFISWEVIVVVEPAETEQNCMDGEHGTKGWT